MVVVDVANVMGARADGWWRDRAGAAARLCREVKALAHRGHGSPPEAPETPAASEVAGVAAWVLVLEGQARAAVELLADELNELDQELDDRAEGEPALVRLVSAPGSGDDTIVSVVADALARDETCLVVTADRELRRRCEELNASVVGPGWLLRLL
jgi:8-oxo-dGTP diphosphatase